MTVFAPRCDVRFRRQSTKVSHSGQTRQMSGLAKSSRAIEVACGNDSAKALRVFHGPRAVPADHRARGGRTERQATCLFRRFRVVVGPALRHAGQRNACWQTGDPVVLRSAKWFADAHALFRIPLLQSLADLRKYRSAVKPTFGKPFVGFGDPEKRRLAALSKAVRRDRS